MSTITAGKYNVVLEQIPRAGTPWMVRVYRKVLFFKKRVSSDWFLTEAQARLFAEQLATDLAENDGVERLKARQPGWVLHRAPR
jgi:hypothetical protein